MKYKSIKELASKNGYIKIAALLGIGLLLIFFGIGGQESASTEAVANTLDGEIAELCSSLDGVGECRVLVIYEQKSLGYGRGTESVIAGIAVICDGGDSAAVRQRVSSVLSSIFGIGTNRIKVEKLSSSP